VNAEEREPNREIAQLDAKLDWSTPAHLNVRIIAEDPDGWNQSIANCGRSDSSLNHHLNALGE
jgi:hypothetical protein